MNRLFKHELVFLGVAAVLVAVYLFVGLRLAPTIPPEPKKQSGGVTSLDEFVKQQKKLNERKAAHKKYDRFVRVWTQWGAGVGAVLIVAYTLWRPPWFVVASSEAASKNKQNSRDAQSKSKRPAQRSAIGSRISKQAMVMMIATVVLLIIAVVLLAAILGW